MCIISKQIDAYCDINDNDKKCSLCGDYRCELCNSCSCDDTCECEEIEDLNVNTL